MKDLLAALAGNSASVMIQKITGLIVNPLIVVMFAAALIGFLWGIKTYITNADDHEARMKGATHIMWGLVGMLIMIAAFTLVRIVLNTFGLGQDSATTNDINNIIGR